MSATPQNPWLRLLTGPIAAAVVLAAFYLVLLASLRDKSATFDEPGHATAGYAYWKFGDYRIDPENGNLPQRWIALPLLFGGFRFPPFESAAWQMSDTWALADEWFNRLGNDTSVMLARGRAACGLFAVALGAMVWLWSRQLFGPLGGMVSLLLYVLNPTILANGALMTSDIAGALFLLVSLWCLWSMLQKLSPQRVLLSAIAMGVLFVVKMSAVIIAPVALVLAAVRMFDRLPLPISAAVELASPASRGRALGAAALVHLLAVICVVWAAYGFRFSAFAPDRAEGARFAYPWAWALDRPDHAALLTQLQLEPAQQQQAMELFKAHGALTTGWSYASLAALQDVRRTVLTPAQVELLDALTSAPSPSTVARLADFAYRHHLLPEAYIYGYAHVWKLSGARAGFLNGEFRQTGWHSFFPFAFLVKTPLALFGIVALAAATAARRLRSTRNLAASPQFVGLPDHETLPLWLFHGAFWAVAIFSHINIGHRHLLPVYPPLFVLCGAAAYWFAQSEGNASPSRIPSRASGAAVGSLVTILAIETACWFPNYLAYFNGFVRPSQAYRHLVDSSLDWGQDLPAVKHYIEKHPESRPAYLAYFGMGSPACHGIDAVQFYAHPGFEKALRPAIRILPGLSPEKDRAKIDEFLRREPTYDPDFIAKVEFGDSAGTLLLKRASALRLERGTYFISATLLQPVHHSRAFGPWSAAHEATYQRLNNIVQPLLSDNLRTRASALEQQSAVEWLHLFDEYDEFRFARLTAFLRQREPDAHLNYSILIYHLSTAEIARILTGPPPN